MTTTAQLGEKLNLRQWLRATLTINDYLNLHRKMGLSRQRWLDKERDPHLLQADEILRLSKLLMPVDSDATPRFLYERFQAGRKVVTIDEMEQILAYDPLIEA